MAIHIKIHPEDEQELATIRLHLWKLRQKLQLPQNKCASLAGHSEKWLSEIEQGIGHPHLSSLQDWAAVFDLRVEPEVFGLDGWGPDDVSLEHLMQWQLAYRMSRPFGEKPWLRAWLMADLIAHRQAAKIPAAQLSRDLGLSVSAVSGWERDGADPLISKVFTYVRALGGRVRLHLVTRAMWAHK